MSELVFRNRQRSRRVNTRLLRQIARTLLGEFVGVKQYELCVHLVGAAEMARINSRFLQHEGSTDVITFDHCRRRGDESSGEALLTSCPTVELHGEIFICLDDAIAQARQFRATWQAELVRYVVHGVLHLLGHDDLKAAARRKMKREENRLVREMSARFALSKLKRAPKLRP
ncbi:MAG: rRNA maturation RNase YbeY [Pedosphaera sp.]|nr:rRNA maturation RNase YbeY [Pedosphaera sp.]